VAPREFRNNLERILIIRAFRNLTEKRLFRAFSPDKQQPEFVLRIEIKECTLNRQRLNL